MEMAVALGEVELGNDVDPSLARRSSQSLQLSHRHRIPAAQLRMALEDDPILDVDDQEIHADVRHRVYDLQPRPEVETFLRGLALHPARIVVAEVDQEPAIPEPRRRARSHTRPVRGWAARRALRRGRARLRRPRASCAGPVSYTHLRAH